MLNTAASSLFVCGGLKSAFHRYYPIWVIATVGGTEGREETDVNSYSQFTGKET